jgi:hypothetical protein
MKITKDQFQLGDIITYENKGIKIAAKVVEICQNPVYDAANDFQEVYPIIVDCFVRKNGSHTGRCAIIHDEEEFELVYRENPLQYEPLDDIVKSLKTGGKR